MCNYKKEHSNPLSLRILEPLLFYQSTAAQIQPCTTELVFVTMVILTGTRTLSLKDCINQSYEAKVRHSFLKSKFSVMKIGKFILRDCKCECKINLISANSYYRKNEETVARTWKIFWKQ
jgi:hypothetical protein